MKCDGCGSDESVVHFTEIKDGVMQNHHWCIRCAQGEAGCGPNADLSEVMKKLLLRFTGKVSD
jgi:protein-arginine kinase activator protein McsA